MRRVNALNPRGLLRRWSQNRQTMLLLSILWVGLVLLGLGCLLGDERTHSPGVTGEPCTDRVFLAGDGAYSWGSFTRWRGGHVTAHHVIASGAVKSGPQVAPLASLPETDFAFLSGAPTDADPSSTPFPSGRVILEGFPARASHREIVSGEVYAPDTVPPGLWVMLDHPEPLVGGFSGGCVRNAAGEAVAVIMGASSMRLNGQTRHFARVIPIRAALAEHQGQPPASPPVALMSRPLPALQPWPEQRDSP